jgi:hypothetical protein
MMVIVIHQIVFNQAQRVVIHHINKVIVIIKLLIQIVMIFNKL